MHERLIQFSNKEGIRSVATRDCYALAAAAVKQDDEAGKPRCDCCNFHMRVLGRMLAGLALTPPAGSC